ncbi:MAG: IS4 family transposase, partial [Acidobacteria bacterium]
MRFYGWSPRRWAGRSPRPPSARAESVFPLGSLRWLWGRLVAALTARTSKLRWRGLRLLAADHTALNLPETKALYKRFGAHKGKKGLGAITVEFACLFHVLSRAPFRYTFDPCKTSDHELLRALLPGIRKADLVLLDNGFYSLAAFLLVRHRLAHFLIPIKKSGRPRVLNGLGPSDYLCRIESQGQSLTVRVIFVYRDGFRRRRLVTSLLDPDQYPAAELAEIYHKRWDIETFYRDFKRTMKA